MTEGDLNDGRCRLNDVTKPTKLTNETRMTSGGACSQS
jgi:hypothetical protein